MPLYDISPPLTPALAVFPGDTPLTREVLQDQRRGEPITLSTLRATVHLGAHADAPSHYGPAGRSIEAQPLELYLGPCEVVALSVSPGTLITPDHFAAPPQEERLLLATGTFPDPTVWREDFAALAVACVDWLHQCGVRLVGIDTPSVDPATSRELPAHRRFLAYDMAILEGLWLKDVPRGRYELIALPLRLVGFDASPVRAVLRGPLTGA